MQPESDRHRITREACEATRDNKLKDWDEGRLVAAQAECFNTQATHPNTQVGIALKAVTAELASRKTHWTTVPTFWVASASLFVGLLALAASAYFWRHPRSPDGPFTQSNSQTTILALPSAPSNSLVPVGTQLVANPATNAQLRTSQTNNPAAANP